MKKKFFLFFLFTPFFSHSQPLGTWKGYIKLSAKDSLALVLTIEKQEDSISMELDSPDQYVFHKQATSSSYQNDTLAFAVKSWSASYSGAYSDEKQLINGVFTQYKQDFPLVLYKEEGRIIPQRPQTPQPPFPYNIDEDIAYIENKIPVVRGTLTWPSDGKPKALVILISGSGWQDRDETMFLHKPFFVIADYLTRQGYAVFRYDDLPPAKYRTTTTQDFAFYAGMIIDSLKNDERCIGIPIGLLGHSEGGLIAAMCASKRNDVEFIVSLAGVGIPLSDLLVYQAGIAAAQAGFSETEIEPVKKMNVEFYQLVKKSANQQKAVAAVDKWFHKTVSTMSNEERERYQFTNNKLLEIKQLILNNWMYALIKYDPAVYLKKCKLPFLALNGNLDRQVESKPNLSAIEKNIPKNSHNRFIELPGLNHLFQTATTGYMNEYGQLEETLSPEVLEIVKEWLEKVRR
ncbi:MAG: alpha/beta hydrolase [Bacteroidales bacterium]|nr:alpha/beta hydrolase [Bacteroidales bacterium]